MMNLLDSEVVSTTEPMTHAEVNKRLSAMVNLMAGNPLAIAIANGRDLAERRHGKWRISLNHYPQ